MQDDPSAPLVLADDLLAAGFIALPRLVWRNTALSLAARGTWIALLDFAWEAERACWPGYPRLLERLGCSHTSLTKYLRELQAAGYLTVRRRGQGRTNIYTLHAQPRAERKILAIKESGTLASKPIAREVPSRELDRGKPGRKMRPVTPRPPSDASRDPHDHFDRIAQR